MGKLMKTATEIFIEAHQKARAERLVKEFHEYWEQNGEPHPNSNVYLSLNRAFFFLKGMEEGIKVSSEMGGSDGV